MSNAAPDVASEQTLEAVPVVEARLLDEARYDEWNALFAADGVYWMPVSPSATDPRLEASHLYDDRVLREVRLARLRSPHAHSQQPPGRSHHLLQRSDVLSADRQQGQASLRTPFIYHELRAGRTIILPGVAWHSLVGESGGGKIALKRVDLLHSSEPLPAVEFYV